MKKLLLLIDKGGLNKNAFEFGCYLANLTGSMLTGLFMDPEYGKPDHNQKKAYSEVYLGTTPIVEDLPESHWKTQLAENKKAFALACSNKNIRWNDQVSPVGRAEDVIIETRFSDLLIICAESQTGPHPEATPGKFVRELLMKAECPVVIAPHYFTGIEEIVFACDGSASAVYAIKQFTCLFPQLTHVKVTYLEVAEKRDKPITAQQRIGEYLEAHYSVIQFLLLHGKVSDQLFGYLFGKKSVFVVTGAYGRNILLFLLKKSKAEILLKSTNLPVFIAHQ